MKTVYYNRVFPNYPETILLSQSGGFFFFFFVIEKQVQKQT